MAQHSVLTLAKFDDLHELVDSARQENMPIMLQRNASGRDRDWLWVDMVALVSLSNSLFVSFGLDVRYR
jgi:hypothetical protein